MIKLKNILNEFDYISKSSHLDVEVLDLFMTTMIDTPRELTGVPLNLWDMLTDIRYKHSQDNHGIAYITDMSGLESYRLPDEFFPLFKNWVSKQMIWSGGKLFVVELNNIYFLIDPAGKKMGSVVLGFIEATPLNNRFSHIKNVGKFYKLSGKQIRLSAINPAFRGKGYGALLYDVVLNHAKVLFSDSTLYKGSYNLWRHHMQKKAFFGIALINNSYYDDTAPMLIPLNASTDNKWIENNGEAFVAAVDRSVLPKTIRLLEYNTQGIDLSKEFAHGWTDILRFNLHKSFRELVYTNKYPEYPYLDSTLVPPGSKIIGTEKIPSSYTFEDYLDNSILLRVS